MSLMTFALADTDGPDGSWTAGYTDGELAAMTGLSSRRIHARAAMADDHDPDYATGLIDGYLHTIAVNAARAEGVR
ncbi:hypothetical protein OG369_42480 [Streptomyces sp. NBC_01221]|uniref:hypothetical protein n=1 Tax=Streptomyces sp. NBC_01221 TaxID=2903782 RepID=UPI00225C2621|nr:hypothetical protein [Streptomyces sp. NBC_01221]MCX4792446.1 hypothetical protein [Streptomyces sp. NBC_01221]